MINHRPGPGIPAQPKIGRRDEEPLTTVRNPNGSFSVAPAEPRRCWECCQTNGTHAAGCMTGRNG